IEPHVANKDTFLLAVLSGTTQSMLPPEGGFGAAEFSSANLQKIDSKEKLWSILAAMPDEAAPGIERMFDYLIKKALPALRSGLQQQAEQLPPDPGGRPSKWPSQEICLKICDKISA